MKFDKSIGACAALTAIAAVGVACNAYAGGDKVAFPETYASGVLYTTVDRADNKQFRELYVSPPAAVEAAKKGEPMPSFCAASSGQFGLCRSSRPSAIMSACSAWRMPSAWSAWMMRPTAMVRMSAPERMRCEYSTW